MEKVSEKPLLFCRNLQANAEQFFWDTLYNHLNIMAYDYESSFGASGSLSIAITAAI